MTRKAKFYAYLIFIFILLLFIFFNDYGLIKFLRIRSEINEINLKVKNAEQMLDSLDNEINRLKNDLTKVEEVAREKYNMRKKNEKSLKIEVR